MENAGPATHPRRRLIAVSPNLYATAFGLAGLVGAWRLVNQFDGTPAWIEDALYLVATVLYLLLVATCVAKLIDQPKAGAMFLGFVLLATITVLIVSRPLVDQRKAATLCTLLQEDAVVTVP